MPVVYDVLTECLNKSGFTDAGDTGDTYPDAAPGMG